MPFNGSGVFVRLYSWVTDQAAGTKIIATRHDAEDDGIVQGLNDVVNGTQGFIGAVKGTNGTAASPAYSFTDDPDTGVYRVSADKLGFSVAGTQEMVVEAGYIDAVNGFKLGGTAITATATEVNYLSGVTIAIQTQIDGKQASDQALTDISGLAVTDGNIIVGDGTNWVAESGATARTSLGLAIGTDVLAYDANLQGCVNTFTLPTVDGTSGQVIQTNGAGVLSFVDGANGDLLAANNLSDVANAATSRTNLGLGSISTQEANSVSITGGSITGITDIAIADGGTGASTASGARTNLGLAIGTDVLAHDANLQSFVTTFTLPTTDSTNGFALVTNGAGTLSFAAAGASNFSDLGDVYTTGNSIGIGTNALDEDDGTSNRNVGLGENALQYVTSGTGNIGIGYNAGTGDSTSKATGSHNIALGQAALFDLTTGGDNIGLGNNALNDATTGNYNIGLGDTAGGALTTGSQNIFLGRNAGYFFGSAKTGDDNVGIGYNTLRKLTTGYDNVVIGVGSGGEQTTGFNNVSVGAAAGDVITTGSNNVTLGFNSDPTSATASNEVTLGNSSITALRCQQTTITALSDERDKENITDLRLGLDYINEIRPVEFDWNTREGSAWDGKHVAGFIAQDLMAAEDKYDAAFLGSVLRNNPNRLEAGPAALIPVMVQAIKDLSKQNEMLEERLAALEAAQ